MAAILVTGSAGFLGSAVAMALLSCGETVVGADCVSTTRLPAWRLTQLRQFPAFRFISTDISNRDSCELLFRHRHFGAVVHFAGVAGVRLSIRNPWSYITTNVTGTLNILDMCQRYGVQKFVLASTSSVYGEGVIPSREDAQADRHLSPYATSKKSAEDLAHVYHFLYDIDVTILRYFTVYGPAGRPDMSVLKFIHYVAEGLPVPIYGDGTQRRDYTYVDDTVRGSVAALKPLGFEVVNLGSSRPVEVNHVIQLIASCLGKRVQVVHEESFPTDPSVTHADITKAARVLNWQPEVFIEEGVERTSRWYLDNRDWVKYVID